MSHQNVAVLFKMDLCLQCDVLISGYLRSFRYTILVDEKFPWGQTDPKWPSPVSLKADDDTRMSLQFSTITSFIGTVESRHPQSKTDDERSLPSILPLPYFCLLKLN